MNEAHVAGGAVGALLGAIVAPLLAKYGVHVTDSTASLIGVAAVSLGVGVGHVISKQGIWPAIKRAFVGPERPAEATAAPMRVTEPVSVPSPATGPQEPSSI